MPIQVKLKTHHFKDEEGTEIPDATFTVRTRLSHKGQRDYMRAVTAEMPDLSAAIDEAGNLDPKARPKIGVEMIDNMEKILLRDGLVGLSGVLDASGKEIKVWEEFLDQDEFFVSQVVKILQATAVNDVKKSGPDPNASAPSAKL